MMLSTKRQIGETGQIVEKQIDGRINKDRRVSTENVNNLTHSKIVKGNYGIKK